MQSISLETTAVVKIPAFKIDEKSIKNDLAKNRHAIGPLLSSAGHEHFTFKGKVVSDGISISTFNETTTYSLGVTNPNLQTVLTSYEMVFDNLKLLDDWQYTDMIKTRNNQPVVYLKLELDKNGDFIHNNNLGMVNPNSPSYMYVGKGCNVKVAGTVNAYFDRRGKKYGLYFTLEELEYNLEDIEFIKKYYQ